MGFFNREQYNYKIRLRNGDKEIEIEGNKKYIELMLNLFWELPSAEDDNLSKKPDKIKDKPSSKVGGRTSPAEFVLHHQIKKHMDIVLGFGFYMEKSRGLNKFTPADITNCYYEAKLEPSNTSQMIIQNIKKGFLMEAKGSTKGKKYYTLTQSGLKYVENGFRKHKGDE